MELLYLWVEDYKNIKKQGFNFSPNHWFEVEEKDGKYEVINKTGEKKENGELKEKPNIFGKNISNITAIIGKNGSGKSTLIDAIVTMEYDGISIFKNNNTFYKCQKKNSLCTIKNDINEFQNNKNKIEFICFDNIFNPFKNEKKIKEGEQYFLKNKLGINIMDISTNFEYFIEGKQDKLKYTSNEIKNSLSLLEGGRSKENKILPKTLKIPSIFLIKNIELKTLKYEGYERDLTFIRIFIKNIASIILEKSFLARRGVNDFSLKSQEECFKAIIDILEDEYNSNKSSNAEIEKRIQKILETKYVSNLKYDVEKNILKNSIKIIHKFKKLIEKTNSFSQIKKLGHLSLDLKRNSKEIIEFLEFTKENSIKEHFFEYEYDIVYSSGERGLIKLFSRLQTKANEIGKRNDDTSLIILLDEPEVFAHPEWQRTFLENISCGIKKMFKDKKVQIILTSHSPFVASDLPRENVIMLDVYDENDEEVKNKSQEVGNCKVVTDKNIKTFGANIHNLLANSFFMESTMGEFAKQKITGVLQDLDMKINKDKKLDEQRKEEINYIISNIGEPVIKTKLQQMYDRAFPKESNNYLKLISDLENEIRILTKDKENPKNGLDALRKLKEKISEYEEVLKKVGDVNDKD